MMTRPGPIVLTTRTLGAATGVSQAALDVALALSRHAEPLRIRAWVPRALPQSWDGRSLGPWVPEPVSPLTAAKAVRAGEAPPRALIEHGVRAATWLARQLLPLPAAALEVVNGLGAHALFAAEMGWAGQHRARPTSASTSSVLIVHESPGHFAGAGRMSLGQAESAIASYDDLVFVSEQSQRDWHARLELPRERSFYIPNCVSEQRVRAVTALDRAGLRARFGYAPGTVHAVCVGQVSLRKGQDLVIEAMRALPPEVPLRLDVLGDYGTPWARALVASVHSSPLGSRVRFLGRVRDVYERVYAADLLVLSSRAEAFPLVVLEAMALGTCVVAADVDGVREQVVPEQTGLLFRHEEAGELAQRLAAVARDPAQRACLADAARARYAELFTRERQLALWDHALSQMLPAVRASHS